MSEPYVPAFGVLEGAQMIIIPSAKTRLDKDEVRPVRTQSKRQPYRPQMRRSVHLVKHVSRCHVRGQDQWGFDGDRKMTMNLGAA